MGHDRAPVLLLAFGLAVCLCACKREAAPPPATGVFSETQATADRPAPPPAPLPPAATAVAATARAAPTRPVAASSARFLIFGDSGDANADQLRIGDAMAGFCVKQGCEFAVHTGDIVYPEGIATPDDPLLLSNFERPYAKLNVPIYLSLGNHEHYGNPDAFVAAWADGGPGRSRALVDARLPARTYTFVHNGIRFVVLDTSVLDEAQGRWMDDIVARSRAAGERWLVAVGHHPFRSSGMHGHAQGPTLAWMEEHFCDNIDVYISGHDHNKEVLAPHCGVHQVISGAAAYVRPIEPKAGSVWSASTLGWAMAVMDKQQMVVTFYDAKGQLEARHTIARQPR